MLRYWLRASAPAASPAHIARRPPRCGEQRWPRDTWVVGSMARQIDPWLGVPQTAVLEENLLMVQVRLQGLDVKVRELEARLVQVAQAANEARSDADRANGQTLQLEAQLADIAGACSCWPTSWPSPGPPSPYRR